MFQEILTPQVLLTLAKITAILLAAFAISPFIKHPGLRASLWTTTILTLPLIVAFSSFSLIQLIPNQEQPTPAITQDPLTQNPLLAESLFILDSLDPTPAQNPAAFQTPLTSHSTLPEPSTPFPWLPVLYFFGASLVILPLLLSQLRLRLLKKSPPSGKPNQLWLTLNANHQLKAQLHFTPSPSAPFASGILKPAILIPHESETWSASRLQATLLHEVAHLKRHDPLTRFLSSLVKALLWFHPLVWLAHRQLIATQEQACDQYALTAGIEPQDYAADLLRSTTHSHTTPSQALAFARWSQLGNRIRHILNQENHRPLSMKKIISTCTLFALTISSIGFAKDQTSRHITLVSVNDTIARISITPDAKPKKIIALIDQLQKNGTHLFILQSPDEKNQLAQITFSNSRPLVQFPSQNTQKNIQELSDAFDEKMAQNSQPTREQKWKHATATLKINDEIAKFLSKSNQPSIEELLETESQIRLHHPTSCQSPHQLLRERTSSTLARKTIHQLRPRNHGPHLLYHCSPPKVLGRDRPRQHHHPNLPFLQPKSPPLTQKQRQARLRVRSRCAN